MSLSTEGVPEVNLDNWKKTLRAHPEFSPLYEQAKGEFVESSIRRLVANQELRYLCWLLERRHSDLFRKPPEQSISSVAVSSTKDLSDAELLAIARSASPHESGEGPAELI